MVSFGGKSENLPGLITYVKKSDSQEDRANQDYHEKWGFVFSTHLGLNVSLPGCPGNSVKSLQPLYRQAPRALTRGFYSSVRWCL